MGGTNETKIGGLRVHVGSDGKVHLHDDSSNRKFKMPMSDLKKALTEAQSTLARSDGVVMIEGETQDTLLVGRKGKDSFAVVLSSGDGLADLKRWADAC